MKKILLGSVFAVVFFLFFASAAVVEAAAPRTEVCYSTCTRSYSNWVGRVTLDLRCNSTSPASYVGRLWVNGRTHAYTKYCNKPPVASISGPSYMPYGTPGQFTGSSYDPNGDSINSYIWKIDNVNKINQLTGSTVHYYTPPSSISVGNHTVTYCVLYNGGSGGWSGDNYDCVSKSFTVQSPSCSGFIPSSGTACTGDGTGLMSFASWHAVGICGGPKCEYTCKSGYKYISGSCVPVNVTANFSLGAAECYTGNINSGSASVNMQVTGGNAVGNVTYLVDCGDGLGTKQVYSGSNTSYTHICKYDSAGTKTITARVEREGAGVQSGNMNVNIADCEPKLLSFGTPQVIRAGEKATLSWRVENTNWCFGKSSPNDPAWTGYKYSSIAPQTFDEDVSPDVTTTYQLYCGNDYDETRDEAYTPENEPGNYVAINVIDLSFTAIPNPVVRGNTVTLDWDPINVDSCESSGGSWPFPVAKASSGLTEEDVIPSLGNNSYDITCEKGGTTITRSVTVDMLEPTCINDGEPYSMPCTTCTNCITQARCESKMIDYQDTKCNSATVACDPPCETLVTNNCDCTGDDDAVLWYEDKPQ